jgi:hypothetical protein
MLRPVQDLRLVKQGDSLVVQLESDDMKELYSYKINFSPFSIEQKTYSELDKQGSVTMVVNPIGSLYVETGGELPTSYIPPQYNDHGWEMLVNSDF